MSKSRKFGKNDRVGNPILIKTTYDEDQLDLLPDVREGDPARLIDGRSLNPAEDARRRKRISDAPTASSVYTEPSPKFRYDFEQDPPVLPLFAKNNSATSQQATSKIPAPTFGNNLPAKRLSGAPIKRKQLPPNASPRVTTPSPPPVENENKASSFAERAARAGVTELGTTPAALRPLWNGASGRSALMTPIADLPSNASDTTRRSSQQSGDGQTPVPGRQRSRSRSPMVSPLGDDNEDGLHTWRQRLVRDNRSASPTLSPTSESEDEHVGSSTGPWHFKNSNIEEMQKDSPSTARPKEQESSSPIYKFSSPVKQALSESVQERTQGLPTQPSDSTIRPSPPQNTQSPEPTQEPSTPVMQQGGPVQQSSSADHATYETPQQEPRSRFSWTTHATSAAATPQGRPSAEEQLPTRIVVQQTPDREPKSRFSWTTMDTSPQATPPRAHASQPRAIIDQSEYYESPPAPFPAHITNSIMARRRPFPPSSPPKRKPVPSASVTTVSNRRKGSLDAAMPIEEAKSKPLPTTPTVLDSVDTVTAIEANMTDLAIRRHNLEKLISSLTDPLQASSGPGNPMVVDLAKRREMKDRVSELEAELWDVRKEEHELGLRLHRAWKRREKNIEGSNMLWVRRVTS